MPKTPQHTHGSSQQLWGKFPHLLILASRIAVVSVACMPVGHGAWKTSEPLSDLDQLLSIAMHDPNVNAKQMVGVCNTQ